MLLKTLHTPGVSFRAAVQEIVSQRERKSYGLTNQHWR